MGTLGYCTQLLTALGYCTQLLTTQQDRVCTYKATDTKTQKIEIKRRYPKHIQYISKRYSHCLFRYKHTLSEGSSIEPRPKHKHVLHTCKHVHMYMYMCTCTCTHVHVHIYVSIHDME